MDNLLDDLKSSQKEWLSFLVDKLSPLQKNTTTLHGRAQWQADELGRAKQEKQSYKHVATDQAVDGPQGVYVTMSYNSPDAVTVLFNKDTRMS